MMDCKTLYTGMSIPICLNSLSGEVYLSTVELTMFFKILQMLNER